MKFFNYGANNPEPAHHPGTKFETLEGHRATLEKIEGENVFRLAPDPDSVVVGVVSDLTDEQWEGFQKLFEHHEAREVVLKSGLKAMTLFLKPGL